LQQGENGNITKILFPILLKGLKVCRRREKNTGHGGGTLNWGRNSKVFQEKSWDGWTREGISTHEVKRHFRQCQMTMNGYWRDQEARFEGAKVTHVTAQLVCAVIKTLVQYRGTTRVSSGDGNNSSVGLFCTFSNVTLYTDIDVSEKHTASIFRAI
jgi:hypothetical protein